MPDAPHKPTLNSAVSREYVHYVLKQMHDAYVASKKNERLKQRSA